MCWPFWTPPLPPCTHRLLIDLTHLHLYVLKALNPPPPSTKIHNSWKDPSTEIWHFKIMPMVFENKIEFKSKWTFYEKLLVSGRKLFHNQNVLQNFTHLEASKSTNLAYILMAQTPPPCTQFEKNPPPLAAYVLNACPLKVTRSFDSFSACVINSAWEIEHYRTKFCPIPPWPILLLWYYTGVKTFKTLTFMCILRPSNCQKKKKQILTQNARI